MASAQCRAPSAGNDLRQRLPLHQLEDEELRALGFFESVDRGDMRMIERGQQLRLALESSDPFRIFCEELGQSFDGDVAIELGVTGFVDFAHPTGTDGTENLV